MHTRKEKNVRNLMMDWQSNDSKGSHTRGADRGVIFIAGKGGFYIGKPLNQNPEIISIFHERIDLGIIQIFQNLFNV